ncbi:hypothetical protein BDF14DRAFT_1030009 [Spinellus fusiger]|nr:hypothetical protein BDF14DRAFT_1030009 [Spinellus fusiger]
MALSQTLFLEEKRSSPIQLNSMGMSSAYSSNDPLQMNKTSTTHSTRPWNPQVTTANNPLLTLSSKNTTTTPQDSIYSSYLGHLNSLDASQKSDSFESSIFSRLMSPSSTTTDASTCPTPPSFVPTAVKPVPVVLDSDVSDSEDSKLSESEDDLDTNVRRTKGMLPILSRRTRDQRLVVQRKIDRWNERVDPNATVIEANESMIERMKDRHREQYKMVAIRTQLQHQQQQHQQFQQQYQQQLHQRLQQQFQQQQLPHQQQHSSSPSSPHHGSHSPTLPMPFGMPMPPNAYPGEDPWLIQLI